MILKKAVLEGSGKPGDSGAILGKLSRVSCIIEFIKQVEENSIKR